MGFTTKRPTNNEYRYDQIAKETNAVAFISDSKTIFKVNEPIFISKDFVNRDCDRDLLDFDPTETITEIKDFISEDFVNTDYSIECRLRRARIGGSLNQIVQFSKNGKEIGYPLAIKTHLPLYPSLWIDSNAIVVETNLDQRSIESDFVQGKMFKTCSLKFHFS